jgi:hypothetical protein
VKHADIHEDLRQLSYRLVKVRSYGRYDVNGFHFRSTQFVALRPLRATTTTGVVMRTIDAEGWETNYYRIINYILEFNFTRNKELRPRLAELSAPDSQAESGELCQTLQNQDIWFLANSEK